MSTAYWTDLVLTLLAVMLSTVSKKGVGCRNAIHTVRIIVDKMIEDCNTVNMCAIDLSKAFDKVNHKGLFTKLMKRHIPTELLELLEIGCQCHLHV